MIIFTSKKGLMIFAAFLSLLFFVLGINDLVEATRFKNDITKAMENNKQNIALMTSSEYEPDMNVYGDVLYLLGCYCEETRTNETSTKITGSYYIMPIWSDADEETRYITILLHNQNNVEAFENITNDTYDMLDGKENIDWHNYYFYGKVKPLDNEARQYMIDFFKEADAFEAYDDATVNKYVLPYQLEEFNYEVMLSNSRTAIIFGTVIAAVLVVILAVMYAKKQRERAEYFDRIAPMPVYKETQSDSYSEEQIKNK